MRFAGLGLFGRFATRLASLFAPPYKGRRYLAKLGPLGYIAPSASIYCKNLNLGHGIFVGDRVIIYQADGTGSLTLGDHVAIHQDTIIEMGQESKLSIGSNTHIQPRCQLSAYKGSIKIGNNVQIAPFCAFYPYNHGLQPGIPMIKQPLESQSGIVIEDNVWLGCGVIVLDGAWIRQGAVIGAGAVVTSTIPEGAIAAGIPARVIKMRCDLVRQPNS